MYDLIFDRNIDRLLSVKDKKNDQSLLYSILRLHSK